MQMNVPHIIYESRTGFFSTKAKLYACFSLGPSNVRLTLSLSLVISTQRRYRLVLKSQHPQQFAGRFKLGGIDVCVHNKIIGDVKVNQTEDGATGCH
jgi:hypothetical protein